MPWGVGGSGSSCCGRGTSGPCNITVNLSLPCSGDASNIVVEALDASNTVVGSGTTGYFGSCTIDVGAPGTYTFKVTSGSFAGESSSATVACGDTVSITVALPAGYTCCGECSSPHQTLYSNCTTLSLVDPLGNTITLSSTGSTSQGEPDTFRGSFEYTAPAGSTDTCSGSGSGKITIDYLWYRCNSNALFAFHPTIITGTTVVYSSGCYQDMGLLENIQPGSYVSTSTAYQGTVDCGGTTGTYTFPDSVDTNPSFSMTHTCAEQGRVYTITVDFARRASCINTYGNSVPETADHPLAAIFGTAPTWSLTYCS